MQLTNGPAAYVRHDNGATTSCIGCSALATQSYLNSTKSGLLLTGKSESYNDVIGPREHTATNVLDGNEKLGILNKGVR